MQLREYLESISTPPIPKRTNIHFSRNSRINCAINFHKPTVNITVVPFRVAAVNSFQCLYRFSQMYFAKHACRQGLL